MEVLSESLEMLDQFFLCGANPDYSIKYLTMSPNTIEIAKIFIKHGLYRT
jgi:hypothetical protein